LRPKPPHSVPAASAPRVAASGTFWNTYTVSYSFSGGCTSLHDWMRGTATQSKSRARVCTACRSRSHAATVCSGGTRTRTGTVLMNIPSAVSTPGTAGGRPETIAPKSTSSSPECCASSRPHAPWSSVFSVTP
jgi:hypothetical protein